jgi:hypothetical protein
MQSNLWITDREVRQDLSLSCPFGSKALVFLCLAALSARHGRKDLYLHALESKQECLQLLKAGNEISLQAHLYLFIAATYLNHIDEAHWHARQIYVVSTIPIFARLHHYDVRCAIMHLRPPLLDPQEIIDALSGGEPPLRLWLQSAPSKIVCKPRFSKALEDIYRQLQGNIIYQATSYNDRMGQPPAGDLYWIFRGTSLLFNHLKLSKKHIKKTSGPVELVWRGEYILSLCGLAFLGSESPGPVIAGLRKRVGNVFAAIRHELEEEHLDDTHQKICLWALYLGAIWDFQCRGVESWFRMELRRRCFRYGMRSWDKLKQLTDQFLVVPCTRQVGKAWILGVITGRDVDEPYTEQAREQENLINLDMVLGSFPSY